MRKPASGGASATKLRREARKGQLDDVRRLLEDGSQNREIDERSRRHDRFRRLTDRRAQRVDTHAAASDGDDDRHAQSRLQRRGVDPQAPLLRRVHHVEGDHDRNARFHELEGERRFAREGRGVETVDHHIRSLAREEVAGHPLLKRVGRERVGSRRIHDLDREISVAISAALFSTVTPG